jgi:starch phosphorylase
VGEENFFLFGLTEPQVRETWHNGYRPGDCYAANPVLKRVVDALCGGDFSGGDREVFRPIVHSLLGHDPFLTLADFQAYVDAQDRVDAAYRDRDAWTRMSILNTARCGFFSSDRSIREYCQDIWKVSPVPVPDE